MSPPPDDEGPDGPDDGPDDSVEDAAAPNQAGVAGELEGQRRRRRRRRRRGPGGEPAAAPHIPSQSDAPTRVELAAEVAQEPGAAGGPSQASSSQATAPAPAGQQRGPEQQSRRQWQDRGDSQQQQGRPQQRQDGPQQREDGSPQGQAPRGAGEDRGRGGRPDDRGPRGAVSDAPGGRPDDRGPRGVGSDARGGRPDDRGPRGSDAPGGRPDERGPRGAGSDARGGSSDDRGPRGSDAPGGRPDERGSRGPGGGRDGGRDGGARGGRDGGARGGRDGDASGARGARGGGEDRFRDQRGRENRLDPGQEADLRTESDDVLRGDPYRDGSDASDASDARSSRSSQPAGSSGSNPIAPHAAGRDDDDAPVEASSTAWGTDDGAPAPAVVLAADMPTEPPADDPDPTTYHLIDGPAAQLGDDVASVVGVRFVAAGRLQWCDAGESDFVVGERVLVDTDRGQRLGWIATPPTRRPVRDRNLRRVIRRANEVDLRGELAGDHDKTELLRLAKDKAAALRLPLKVFRVEKAGNKLNVYYTSDERLDLRDFVRDVGGATNLRLELRQLGVRDEAKMVGGIGSCGLTLCCTTWLPDFVPVSIKMAKDQGLVLSPTKVSGQCGRLKCCLVYEQAGYAEMRKGLPKLGKRVISARGEGRVVEVDVLRQRIRVSYGAGDTEVLPATEVKPMFPSGNQPGRDRDPSRADHDHDHDGDHDHDAPDEPDLPSS